MYPTDLTDEQGGLLEPLLPAAKQGGRPRTSDLRLVLTTIFYRHKAGCPWAMLPTDLAQRSTANDYFNAWKAAGTWQTILDTWRRPARVAAGHEPEPQKAAIDAQTVKGSEAGGVRGYDGGKKINGRKRHVIVECLGILRVVLVTSANADDGTTAPAVLTRLTPEQQSRLAEIRGDSTYNKRTRDRYLATAHVRYQITVVERPPGVKGLVHVPYRWVIERTNAGTGKYRRNSKDSERTTASAESMIRVTMIHLLLQRLKPDNAVQRAAYRYERKPLQKAG